MSLASGARLGPYEILSVLGAGGMGEVYRARDARLGRDVAIKILPDAVAGDPERLARFHREAQVLASLNHPNIAHIHGYEESNGLHAIVMELVEGPTLAGRIANGPIPLTEALPIAKQVAEALEAAHEQGIIHRDLKPANIKVREDGTVKVLDFGLAKLLDPTISPNGNATMSPTMSVHATMAGTLLGTAAYMSPEQAAGKALDRRGDIWSFGVVLWEMLTGRPLFAGETLSETLADVLRAEIDFSRLPTGIPATICQLLKRCLDRNIKTRLRDIGEARIAVDRAGAETEPQVRETRLSPRALPWVIAVLAIVALSGVSWLYFLRTPPDAPEVRTAIVTPATTDPMSFALSPDGRQIVFVASGGGAAQLWLQTLDKTEAQSLAGTEGAAAPFWSPNGKSLGFFAGGKLKRLDLAGGSPQVLTDASSRGGSWNTDDVLLFTRTIAAPLFRIRASGGDAVAVTKLDQQTTHRFPQFLPDGRQFLYYARGSSDTTGIYLASLDRSDAKRVTTADAIAGFTPGGWLLFIRAGTLLAQRLDLQRASLSGDPVVVANAVVFEVGTSAAATSVSPGGLIAYRSGGTSRHQLTWFDRTGKLLSALGTPDDNALTNPRLSPDGQRVAVWRTVQGNSDIWIIDPDRSKRFTLDTNVDGNPIWSPDSDRIVFNSNRKGVPDLYQKLSNFSRDEEILLESAPSKNAVDWSPDGRFISFNSNDPQAGSDIWMLPLDGARKPFPFVSTMDNERSGMFSRDEGRWVAYSSNKSGRFEIYVRPFRGEGPESLVSTNGGLYPTWAYGNRELYYLAPDGALMATPISITGQTFEPGRPVPLFRPQIFGGATIAFGHQYDVSRDGRFLINIELDATATTPITLIQNWKPPAK